MAETKLVVPLSKLVSSNTFNYITIVAFKYRIDVQWTTAFSSPDLTTFRI